MALSKPSSAGRTFAGNKEGRHGGLFNNESGAESENEKQNPNHEPNVSVKHQAERLFVRQKKYSK